MTCPFCFDHNMSEDENEQIARAMALSLQGLEAEIVQEDQEQLDLKAAIAASLGKTVDQLTARDMLFAETPSNNNNKRKREEEEALSGQHRVLKRFDNSNKLFWDGIVKLTYVQGFVGPDYIRFEDIVNKVGQQGNIDSIINTKYYVCSRTS